MMPDQNELRQTKPGADGAPVMTPDLSIVVPLYNEAAGLRFFHARLSGCARAVAAARNMRI
ncbi:MAG: hypothetical protein B7Z15_15120, partial [Rhizobiales bacterium 32-66-8]